MWISLKSKTNDFRLLGTILQALENKISSQNRLCTQWKSYKVQSISLILSSRCKSQSAHFNISKPLFQIAWSPFNCVSPLTRFFLHSLVLGKNETEMKLKRALQSVRCCKNWTAVCVERILQQGKVGDKRTGPLSGRAQQYSVCMTTSSNGSSLIWPSFSAKQPRTRSDSFGIKFLLSFCYQHKPLQLIIRLLNKHKCMFAFQGVHVFFLMTNDTTVISIVIGRFLLFRNATQQWPGLPNFISHSA